MSETNPIDELPERDRLITRPDGELPANPDPHCPREHPTDPKPVPPQGQGTDPQAGEIGHAA
jgi:hypothetical protein